MSENQKINFHPKRFKAYLVLIEKKQTQVARMMDMSAELFYKKINMHHCNKSLIKPEKGRLSKPTSYRYHFTDEECCKLAKVLGMAEDKQLEIFECILVPRKDGK